MSARYPQGQVWCGY